MSPDVTVIAVPSSAGAFSPGQERAPGALRRARLAERLGEHGAAVHDWIELEGFTWRPDRDRPRAQHVEAVRRVATRTAEAVAAQLRAGRRVVVLGGDCTVGIGTVAGAVSATGDAGLVYLDRHADLNTPDSVAAGTLDWMGMSHMLDAPGALPELAGAFAARPLLAAERVVVLGGDESAWTSWERRQAERLGLARVGQEALVGAPEEAAERALAHLGAACERFLVHFDVDVLDFVDAPYAEETNGRNRGPTLEQATRALGGLWRDPALPRDDPDRAQSHARGDGGSRPRADGRCARRRVGHRGVTRAPDGPGRRRYAVPGCTRSTRTASRRPPARCASSSAS